MQETKILVAPKGQSQAFKKNATPMKWTCDGLQFEVTGTYEAPVLSVSLPSDTQLVLRNHGQKVWCPHFDTERKAFAEGYAEEEKGGKRYFLKVDLETKEVIAWGVLPDAYNLIINA